ncbi:MAG: hypothetical protein CMN30_29995 [Sandaracinus sp.]|nr:hypothetical protein [Sandaracinus sp.]
MGAALLFGGAAGCSVFDGSLLPADGGETDGTTVETDFGPETPDTGPTGIGCTDGDRQPPPRPASNTDGPDADEIVFGLREVGLEQEAGDAWRDIGLNLDGYCSVGSVPQGECQPPDEDATLLLDGNQGIDNAFGGELFPLVDLVIEDLEATARESSAAGLGVVVLRVRKYNGELDDPRVDVTMSQSVAGFAGTAEETAPSEYTIVDYDAFEADGTTPKPAPVWEGNDWMVLRDDTFLLDDLEQPLVRDDNAYVANGVLVMSLPERVEIRFAGEENGITVRLTGARALGTISPDGQRLENVLFAGRWSINDLLQTTESLGVCPGGAQFSIFRNKLDSAADLRSDPRTAGDGVTCDALSVGVTFEGYRVRIAGISEGLDPPTDSCP